ncbi:cystathione beta-lyase [[Clostridium] aminophilum]|uniref:cysteine-S-conjugate beta-lyase n=1 Tax=[Clostridium] aminophilum TaxID=1526 RepID=A0A1H9ZYV2_9FIRM|nr:MalY/PatB family protein [[Clostridium] aminophilum]SES86954.1 cystathione beta-lyase [[Clostridium] aminophilum]
MNYNFDEVIDRRNTKSIKYDVWKQRGHQADEIPMWVADMDFRTAQPIIDRLAENAAHGIYGYSEPADSYYEAVIGWFTRHHGWTPERRWFIKTPGIVFAISAAVRAFTDEGDAVLIQQPVYYPFSEAVLNNGRTLINSPLVERNGHYEIDFDDFERKITEHDVKLFLLCNPHNPGGRVWTEEELCRLGEILLKHGVKVVSDEIHCDFTFPGHKHHVFVSLDERFAGITMTCTSPSKTFNLAGTQVSNILISDPEMRRAFRRELHADGYSQMNVFGLTACEAAYSEGEEWYRQMTAYLLENLKFMESFIEERIPEIRIMKPEGTYLVWVDFRRLGLNGDDLENLIREKAKLWLDSGAMFGPEGEGFERFNIACPRALLEKALKQLEAAVQTLRS